MEPTWKSSSAGIINIVSGVVSLFVTFVLGLIALFSTGFGGLATVESGETLAGLPFLAGMVLFGGLAFLGLIFGVIGIWGGIEGLRRGSWAWAIAGSISAFLVLFPVGVLSVIFTLMAEHEFESQGRPGSSSFDGPAPHGPSSGLEGGSPSAESTSSVSPSASARVEAPA